MSCQLLWLNLTRVRRRFSSLPFSNANRYFHFADPLSLVGQGAASNYPRRARGVLVLLASGRARLRSYLEKLTNRQVDGIASGWRARRRECEAEPEISINLLFSSLLIRLACWSEDTDCSVSWRRFSPTVIIGSGSMLASNANQVFNHRDARELREINRPYWPKQF